MEAMERDEESDPSGVRPRSRKETDDQFAAQAPHALCMSVIATKEKFQKTEMALNRC